MLILYPDSLNCFSGTIRLIDLSRVFLVYYYIKIGVFSNGSVGKESACNTGNMAFLPGLGRANGGGHSDPLRYSCLENTMGRGAWQAIVHGVTKSQT